MFLGSWPLDQGLYLPDQVSPEESCVELYEECVEVRGGVDRLPLVRDNRQLTSLFLNKSF